MRGTGASFELSAFVGVGDAFSSRDGGEGAADLPLAPPAGGDALGIHSLLMSRGCTTSLFMFSIAVVSVTVIDA